MKSYFFNQTLKQFKERNIQSKKIIAGVSGGLDSIVLLDLLKAISQPCRLKIYISYIHHGGSSEKRIQDYRDNAKDFVLNLSQKYNLEFLSPKSSKKILSSEEEFRELRRNCFKKLSQQKQADLIALAHNQDDLLETRLIQLIRGCGSQGLKSMSYYDTLYLRPLLFWTRKEINSYALKQNLKWLEDPSNRDNHFLRNWIRNKWLKDLEHKRQGAVKSLARSLETLSGQTEKDLQRYMDSKGIKRQLFMELSLKEKKRVLAFYMRKKAFSNYGQSHIEEILKQNERAQKTFSIQLLKRTWFFTKNYITVK